MERGRDETSGPRPGHSPVDIRGIRGCSVPGSALAYKIGELKTRELRRFTERKLGPRFDVRAFHDHVLGQGQLPFDLLEKRINAWVAAAPQTPTK